MKFKELIVAGCAMAWLAFSTTAAAEVVVIANPASGIDSASAEDIARLYLGKTKAVSGAKLTPVDQAKDSAAATQFYQSVVGKTAAQLRAYWSKLVFTGKGTPPKEVGGDADVVAAVASNPKLVGYVDASAVDGSVKVLMKVE